MLLQLHQSRLNMTPTPRPEQVPIDALSTTSIKTFKTQAHQHKKSLRLGRDFYPSSFDVICGRGKRAYEHAGNRTFRSMCSAYLESYEHASNRLEKSSITMEIVNKVKSESPTKTGFVRQDQETFEWHIVEDHLARDKVGHSFRDIIKARKKALNDSKLSCIHRQLQLKRNALIKTQQEIFYKLLEEDEKACLPNKNPAA